MYDSHGSFAEGYAVGRDTTGANCNAGGMGWGGDWFWGIILIALLFNNGNWGNGWGNGGNFGGGFIPNAVANSYTDSAIQRGFDTQAVITKLDGINAGICSLGYDQLAQMNNLNMSVATGFHGVDNAICTLGYQTAQLANGINQNITENRFASQQCCCETNRNIDAVRYENARNTCDIITAGQANTQRIIDAMTQDKLDTLRDQLQAANFQLSQQAQNAYLVNQLRPCPIPAYLSCSPYQTYGFGPYSGGNNCGCNSNCGC